MAKKNTHVIHGVAHWAKILGDPVPNYGGDNREWTIDVTPDADGTKILRDLGVDSRIKNKGDERANFIQLRQKEKRLDGTLNRAPAVVDEDGRPWPKDKLIGNGTVVDVKFSFRDYGPGKQPGIYPEAIRIREHKEYIPQHFAPIAGREDDEPKADEKPQGHIKDFDDDEFPE